MKVKYIAYIPFLFYWLETFLFPTRPRTKQGILVYTGKRGMGSFSFLSSSLSSLPLIFIYTILFWMALIIWCVLIILLNIRPIYLDNEIIWCGRFFLIKGLRFCSLNGDFSWEINHLNGYFPWGINYLIEKNSKITHLIYWD